MRGSFSGEKGVGHVWKVARLVDAMLDKHWFFRPFVLHTLQSLLLILFKQSFVEVAAQLTRLNFCLWCLPSGAQIRRLLLRSHKGIVFLGPGHHLVRLFSNSLWRSFFRLRVQVVGHWGNEVWRGDGNFCPSWHYLQHLLVLFEIVVRSVKRVAQFSSVSQCRRVRWIQLTQNILSFVHEK